MKLLVTGGAGYIGSVMTAQLLAAGHEVTVFDNLSKGHIQAVPAEAHFVEGNLLNAELSGQMRYRHITSATEELVAWHPVLNGLLKDMYVKPK